MKKQKEVAIHDTTDRMVYGHEPWLEMAGSHGHAGGSVELHLKWGHNMQTDGLAEKDGMAALVVGPGGDRDVLMIADGGPDYYTLDFPAPADGYYHVVTRNTGSYVKDREGKFHRGTRREHPEAEQAVHYVQYAQNFIPVGHDLEGVPLKAEIPLEVTTPAWKQWRAGESIPLIVEFRGGALDGATLDIACSGPGGYRQWQEMTVADGSFTLQAREPGRYLVVVRHRVPEGEVGVYDALSFTTTLFFWVTK